MVAVTVFGAILTIAWAPGPGVMPTTVQALPPQVRAAADDALLDRARSGPATFTAPSRFVLTARSSAETPTPARETRRMQQDPSAARNAEQRRFSPAGMAMGMTWESPISVVDNDRFDMRNLRLEKVSGSKIKGPFDAGLMLKITASTRSMDADLGLTGGARMLSDALTGR
jgi:hypothetical protein